MIVFVEIFKFVIPMLIKSFPIILITKDWRFFIFGIFGPYVNLILYLLWINKKKIRLIFLTIQAYSFNKDECNICFDTKYILCRKETLFKSTCNICNFKFCFPCYITYCDINSNCPVCKTHINIK